MVNAVQILLKDHREIKGMFREFERAGKRAKKTKQRVAEEVIKEIRAHAQLEEQIFYPAAQEKAGKELQEKLLQGIEEHRLADFLMERVQKTPPDDERFDARVQVLIESVRHHLEEEETQTFPKVKKVLAEDLGRLGAEMEELEQRLE